MTESGTVVTYTKAVARWIAKGRPTRSEAQIAELLQICTSCPSYDAESHKCTECGCNLSNSVSPLTNKLAMATEDCPLGKWPKMEGGNIIILGVGHSGTSILTQMLGTLGF